MRVGPGYVDTWLAVAESDDKAARHNLEGFVHF